MSDGVRKRNITAFIITTLAVIALDQAVKALVVALLETGRSVTVIPHVLSITHVRNTGAAFGLLAGSGQLVLWGAIVIVVMTLVWFFGFRHRGGLISFVALGLMIGGAFGNLADRLFRGRVVDFFDLGWWPVFNTADVAIVAGVIILIGVLVLETFRERKPKDGGKQKIAP